MNQKAGSSEKAGRHGLLEKKPPAGKKSKGVPG